MTCPRAQLTTPSGLEPGSYCFQALYSCYSIQFSSQICWRGLPRLQTRPQIQWNTLSGQYGLNWTKKEMQIKRLFGCHSSQLVFNVPQKQVKLMTSYCMWRVMYKTLMCKAIECLLQCKLFSFVTSPGWIIWMSWHHLISKQILHGPTQIIKVINVNFRTLSMSELITSKNWNSFCFIKCFEISGLSLSHLCLIPDFKNEFVKALYNF